MNENIKRLMVKSNVDIRGHYDESGNTPEQLKGFAELIVRDAIAVVRKRYMGDNNREDMEVRRCIEDLKQHFGIEE